MRILIAEDDPVSRRVLQLAVEKLGHTVIQAGNGSEAWRIFDSKPTPLVISDWMMPEIDGLALCRQVRERPNTDYTYFILLTARGGKENRIAAMDAGADDFLEKPLDRDELGVRLRVAERILRYTAQIRQLEGMLPICSYCKKVRNEKQLWDQIERYIAQRTGVSFSHGICPDCYKQHVEPAIRRQKARLEARGKPGQ